MKGLKKYMKNKAMKQIIASLYFVMLGVLISLNGVQLCVDAEETMIKVEMKEKLYEQDILASNLGSGDKKMLLEDENFSERHNQLIDDGWVLQEIVVKNYEIPVVDNNYSQMYGAPSKASKDEGKVVLSSYVQPTKTQKAYNNKKYQKFEDIKKYVAFGSKLIRSKWSWIATKMFSINTSQYAPWFNTGYQKLEENGTLYMKDAYYKEGKKYWIGYSVSKLMVSGTVMSYYRDRNKTPHHKSVDYKRTFKTRSYDKSNAALISLAKKHYNTTGWVNEKATYSSVYKLN